MNTNTHLSHFAAVCGDSGVLSGDAVSAQYTEDWARQARGDAIAVVAPKNAEQTAAVLRYCNEHRIRVVPQGGHTGLSGGAIPHGGIVLSMRRMNRILEIDEVAQTLTAEAGCILENLQREVEAHKLFFPLNLGAKGSCHIGGNLATNAGGLNVLRYGNTRDLCLGLEAVLADGRVLNLLSGLRKNNTGYDLKNLLIGSEGTLAVITAATFKLYPPPVITLTACVAPPSVDKAMTLLNFLKGRGVVSAFEMLPQMALELVRQHCHDLSPPFNPSPPWTVLLELTSPGEEEARELLMTAIEEGLINDAVPAVSETQRQEFWRLREGVPEGVVRHGKWLRTDVSVPLSAASAFVEELQRDLPAISEGEYLIGFGHLGDGNFHVDARPKSADPAANPALTEAVKEKIHACAVAYGGAFSAEHGIGKFKTDMLEKYKDPVAVAIMRDIKHLLDPNGIMNPGAVMAVAY